jgi:tubulin polyglutamylase TTLL4
MIKGPKCVASVLEAAGFEIQSKRKGALGTWGKHLKTSQFNVFERYQHVSHFPLSFQIGRKDQLSLHFTSPFIPETYILPAQKRKFESAFRGDLWIVKPVASARGIGIRVIKSLDRVPADKDIVVSRYVSNPLLIENKKFDLRVYVLVTSFDPLRIYVYEQGLCRFASLEYSTDVRKRCVHLTNYSVNKKHGTGSNTKNGKKATKDSSETPFCSSSNEPSTSEESNTSKTKPSNTGYDMNKDHKWSLDQLRDYLNTQDIDFEPIWQQIEEIIVTSLQSVHPSNGIGQRMYTKASCFELFGYDILIDDQLKPWLMEVNISPALKGSCDFDFTLKRELVRSMFNIVGIRLTDVEEARRHRKGGTVPPKRVLTLEERRKQKQVIHGDRNVLELTEDDIEMLCTVEDEVFRTNEYARSQGTFFKRLWPPSFEHRETKKSLQWWSTMKPTYYDRLMWEWIKIGKDAKRIAVLQQSVKEKPSFASQSSQSTLVESVSGSVTRMRIK